MVPEIPFLSQGQVPGTLILVSFPAQSARPGRSLSFTASLPRAQRSSTEIKGVFATGACGSLRGC